VIVELKQLRHLIVAAEHRSFRRAAASLNIKQSTLSRTIRDVEADLQVQLFERSRAGIRPTAAGGALIKNVRRVMDEIEGLTEIARGGGAWRSRAAEDRLLHLALCGQFPCDSDRLYAPLPEG
jgi:DNA-binding transcriptional LysR family regulator